MNRLVILKADDEGRQKKSENTRMNRKLGPLSGQMPELQSRGHSERGSKEIFGFVCALDKVL